MAIDGTPLDDSLSGTAGDDTMNGLDGDDQLFGGGGVDTLNGGNDNDYLDGGVGGDTLNGGNGDDRMIAGVDDTVNGGTGRDYASFDLSSVSANITRTLDFTAGTVNTLIAGTKFQNIDVLALTTGSGNDTITFDSTAIFGANPFAASSWNGGSGDDHVIVDWSDQTFSIGASSGSITIAQCTINFGGIERFDFYGGSGHDSLQGFTAVDKLVGNGGNDSLYGYGGNDVMQGGDGNDTIYGGTSADNSGFDNSNGGAGDDTIYASYKDSIDGGTGRDGLVLDLADRSADATLVYDPTANSNTVQGTTFKGIELLYLTTGSGQDSLTMTSTAIQISTTTDGNWTAGGDNDTLTVDWSDQIFNCTMNSGQLVIGDFNFSLSSVEIFNYTGGAGNDSLSGLELADVLNGGDGNDNMNGYGGTDTLNGGTGRDTIQGGNDNDTLHGNDDRDTVYGGDGKDKVFGDNGKDTLYGGLADDTLNGGDGNDLLEGDGGLDSIAGGAGNDLIYFAALADSTGKNFDTVDGFSFAEDKFHFAGGVSALDSTQNHGTLDKNTFNADLTSKFAALVSHHAVLFNPDVGSYAGSTFVIVDNNGLAGYQANEDYVVRLTGAANLGSLDVTDFQG